MRLNNNRRAGAVSDLIQRNVKCMAAERASLTHDRDRFTLLVAPDSRYDQQLNKRYR